MRPARSLEEVDVASNWVENALELSSDGNFWVLFVRA